ncbi:MAG: phage tail tape measure protein, partial [Notoacmeibacter sp.]|nr:phage tail tape measure protein [Notoacmeibacter sp.]
MTQRFAAASMAPARVIGGLGRNMRSSAYAASGIAAPLTIAGAAAARAVFEYEKVGNKMRAFGLLTEEQREKLEAYAQTLNKDFPFTNKDILRAAQELFRAGLTYDQAMGALRGSLNLALAGDIDIKEATDIATNVMTAMKLPMRTFDQVQDSLLRVNDALAYAATNSNTDVKLMGDTFRYVAPLAAAAGMELEQVAAVSMELAKAGIKGSEAGVALRSALVRMAKPTKPMLAAFERLGINMKDFVRYRKELDVGGVIGSLRASGFVVDDFAPDLEAILKDKALQAAPARMIAELTDTIVKGIGDEAIREEVASVISDAVTAGAQEVDLFKLLATLRDKNATLTDIAQIFDVRMGSRLAAILSADLDEATAKLKREYAGHGGKVAGYIVDGIVGSTYRVKAALENFAIRLAESGVMDAVASAFERISNAVGRLAKADP